MQLSYQLDEIERAARYLLDQASTAVIRIDGPMGAGKTTLISAAVKILGVTDTVSSPTFSLVNNYQKENEVFIILIFTVSIIQTKPWISGWKNI